MIVICPKCKSSENHCVDSRPTKERSSTRRRLECKKCGNRFTTYEMVVPDEELYVRIIPKVGYNNFDIKYLDVDEISVLNCLFTDFFGE